MSAQSVSVSPAIDNRSAASQAPASASSASTVAAVARQHKLGTFLVALFVLALAAGATYGIYVLVHPAAVQPFEKYSVARVTDSGDIQNTAISPDGKFILTVVTQQGQQSLWLQKPSNGQRHSGRCAVRPDLFFFGIFSRWQLHLLPADFDRILGKS